MSLNEFVTLGRYVSQGLRTHYSVSVLLNTFDNHVTSPLLLFILPFPWFFTSLSSSLSLLPLLISLLRHV